jgi:hypothetical protein
VVGRFWQIFYFAKSVERKVVEGIFELSELRFCQIFQAGFAGLVSISTTFYEQLLRKNPFAKKLQTQIVST